MADTELCILTLGELAALLRGKQVSPVEVTQAYLERIETLDPTFNAYITVTAEQALAEARRCEEEILHGDYRGPLHGIPIALKDLYDTAGVPTTAASRIYAQRVPDEDATSVARLRATGAVILGKTNLHEFAYGVTTASSFLGPTRNPWDQARVPGGQLVVVATKGAVCGGGEKRAPAFTVSCHPLQGNSGGLVVNGAKDGGQGLSCEPVIDGAPQFFKVEPGSTVLAGEVDGIPDPIDIHAGIGAAILKQRDGDTGDGSGFHIGEDPLEHRKAADADYGLDLAGLDQGHHDGGTFGNKDGVAQALSLTLEVVYHTAPAVLTEQSDAVERCWASVAVAQALRQQQQSLMVGNGCQRGPPYLIVQEHTGVTETVRA